MYCFTDSINLLNQDIMTGVSSRVTELAAVHISLCTDRWQNRRPLDTAMYT